MIDLIITGALTQLPIASMKYEGADSHERNSLTQETSACSLRLSATEDLSWPGPFTASRLWLSGVPGHPSPRIRSREI